MWEINKQIMIRPIMSPQKFFLLQIKKYYSNSRTPRVLYSLFKIIPADGQQHLQEMQLFSKLWWVFDKIVSLEYIQIYICSIPVNCGGYLIR